MADWKKRRIRWCGQALLGSFLFIISQVLPTVTNDFLFHFLFIEERAWAISSPAQGCHAQRSSKRKWKPGRPSVDDQAKLDGQFLWLDQEKIRTQPTVFLSLNWSLSFHSFITIRRQKESWFSVSLSSNGIIISLKTTGACLSFMNLFLLVPKVSWQFTFKLKKQFLFLSWSHYYLGDQKFFHLITFYYSLASISFIIKKSFL